MDPAPISVHRRPYPLHTYGVVLLAEYLATGFGG